MDAMFSRKETFHGIDNQIKVRSKSEYIPAKLDVNELDRNLSEKPMDDLE